jgi:hypothetical protein
VKAQDGKRLRELGKPLNASYLDLAEVMLGAKVQRLSFETQPKVNIGLTRH